MSPDRAESSLLSIETIIALLPATFEGWPFCQGSCSPTPDSLELIADQLGVRVPPLLCLVASENPSYGYWFNSIGPDYSNPNHIILVNQRFRSRGVPERYVVFAQDFDGECDAWDLAEPSIGGEFPIVSFCVNEYNQRTPPRRRFDNFHQFMDSLCRHAAPQCPDDEIRHTALRLLGLYRGK